MTTTPVSQSDENTVAQAHATLDRYSEHYRYDVGYIRHLLETDPAAYRVFEAFLPMASFRGEAPTDVIFVAKLCAMQQADCGACLQLAIRQAIEGGMDAKIVRAVLGRSDETLLPPHLAQIQRFVRALPEENEETQTLRRVIREIHGEATLVAISLVVAACGVFPTIKRVFGSFQSCAVLDFEFTA
jgi:hypothetical protein